MENCDGNITYITQCPAPGLSLDQGVYDLTGMEVMSINLKRNQKQMDESNLQSAQYLVSVRSKNGAKVFRGLFKK